MMPLELVTWLRSARRVPRRDLGHHRLDDLARRFHREWDGGGDDLRARLGADMPQIVHARGILVHAREHVVARTQAEAIQNGGDARGRVGDERQFAGLAPNKRGHLGAGLVKDVVHVLNEEPDQLALHTKPVGAAGPRSRASDIRRTSRG
jgi:hypothetical protein